MGSINTINDDAYNIKEIEVDPAWIRDFDNDYREYRKRWELASTHYKFFNFPLFLEVESSYSCNYKCPKCPRQAFQHTKKGGFLDVSLFDKLFDEVKRYKMPSLAFSHGGEPLMRKDIPQLIRKARDSYILDRMFHTNGSLLTKKLSIEVIESGLTKINFSLDAASAGVYSNVRVGGDYEKVINNINEFLEVKRQFGKSYPRVRVSFVISEENECEKDKFYELWKDKVNLIAFQQCYDFSKMRRSNDYKLEGEPHKHRCSLLWQLLTISCEGDVLICERDYDHENVLGNLKTHTIYECWHSDKMNTFRKLHLENRWHEIPMCLRCVTSVRRVDENEIS